MENIIVNLIIVEDQPVCRLGIRMTLGSSGINHQILGEFGTVTQSIEYLEKNGQDVNLALNFNGTLPPYIFDTSNKFQIKNIESPIGLAGITTLNNLSSLGLDVKSMLFMSADRKRFFIVSYLGGQVVDGEYQLGYIGTPYLPQFPCVHVALDSDFWTYQPQTGYIAQSGTMKVVTNDDGTKTVIMENLKLKNLEHDNEFFFPVIDGSLQYHGYMYELSL